MNKVILMGRLTRDIEVRYTTGSNQMAIARYTLAVPRKIKREGEAEADFISCVAFSKAAEFAEKYFRQGTKIAISGRIQTGSYTNREGQKVYTTEVIVEEQEFAESKNAGEASSGSQRDGCSQSRDSGVYRGNENYQNGGSYKKNQNPSYTQQSFSTDRNGFMSMSGGLDEELPFH